MSCIRAVIFDLGGVLVDWDPRHLFRQIFSAEESSENEDEMERFLAEVCTQDWNVEQDRGRSLHEATQFLVAQFPDHQIAIEAFYGRWAEMMVGTIAGSVELLADIKRTQLPVYALSNWSAETFPIAQERFAFLNEFDGMIISGREGIIKPEPAIFALALERFGLDRGSAVFIDDVQTNVDAAEEAGLVGVLFESAAQVRLVLDGLGVFALEG